MYTKYLYRAQLETSKLSESNNTYSLFNVSNSLCLKSFIFYKQQNMHS